MVVVVYLKPGADLYHAALPFLQVMPLLRIPNVTTTPVIPENKANMVKNHPLPKRSSKGCMAAIPPADIAQRSEAARSRRRTRGRRKDVDKQGIERLHRARRDETEQELKHEGHTDVCLALQRPPVACQQRGTDGDELEGEPRAGPFDGERAEVVARDFVDGEADLLRDDAVVDVEELAVGVAADRDADADGQVGDADLPFGEGVDADEEVGDRCLHAVVGGVVCRAHPEHQGGVLVEDDF